ncbi:hypothetical protein KI387_021593, partial [Taxus chinensis]
MDVKFYDVQYRLGLDRPSKTMDWLISTTQGAIDELSQSQPVHECSNTSRSGTDRESDFAETGIGWEFDEGSESGQDRAFESFVLSEGDYRTGNKAWHNQDISYILLVIAGQQ